MKAPSTVVPELPSLPSAPIEAFGLQDAVDSVECNDTNKSDHSFKQDASDELEDKPDEINGSESSYDPLANEGLGLDPSVWDTMLLVGLRKEHGELLISKLDSILVYGLGAINLLLQTCFVFALATTMALNPIDGSHSSSVVSQRVMRNHAYENLDLQRVQTRQKQLCTDQDVYGLLNSYTGNVALYLNGATATDALVKKLSLLSEGATISTIAMMIWSLSMSVEIRRILDLVKAVASLNAPKNSRRYHLSFSEDEDCYVIFRMSNGHKLIVTCVVLLPRLVIALCLLYFGSVWLADTLQISDMILNACALEIVKSVDEYLFDAIISFRNRTIVENTRLFVAKTKAGHEWIVSLIQVLRISAITAWVLFIYFGILKVFHDEVERMHKLMCGFEKDIAWTMHPVTQLPYFAQIGSSTNVSEISSTEKLQCVSVSIYEMVVGRIYDGKPPKPYRADEFLSNSTVWGMMSGQSAHCTQSYCPTVSAGELDDMRSLSSDTFRKSDTCVDQVAHMAAVAEVCKRDAYIKTVPFFSNRTECSHFKHLCECPVEIDEMDECSSDNYSTTIDTYGISYDWIQTLLKLCPATCGYCIQTQQIGQGGMHQGPPGDGGEVGSNMPQGQSGGGGEIGGNTAHGGESEAGDNTPNSGQSGSEDDSNTRQSGETSNGNQQGQFGETSHGNEDNSVQGQSGETSNRNLLQRPAGLPRMLQEPLRSASEPHLADDHILQQRVQELENSNTILSASNAALVERNTQLASRIAVLEKSVERFAALIADERVATMLAGRSG